MRQKLASNKPARNASTFWVIRSGHTAKGWQLVYGGQSVEEERSAHQAESGRSSDTQQRRNVAGGTGSAESDVERLGRILQLRHAATSVSGGRLSRLRLRTAFPPKAP